MLITPFKTLANLIIQLYHHQYNRIENCMQCRILKSVILSYSHSEIGRYRYIIYESVQGLWISEF